MRATDELDRLVLAAVCDDFVTLESIVDKVDRPGGSITGKLDANLLFARLQQLMGDKLINAYLLHADPPYITPVASSPALLPTSWFYITQRGRKCLAHTLRKRAQLQPRDSSSGRHDQYRSAVNF